ncbi:MAG: hypothetical protein IT161_03320 [Bryobacterales bacterium]|nr:hypothetical protein [Bryobacterales bacterium]
MRLLGNLVLWAALLLAGPAGKYEGDWTSAGGSQSGALRVTLAEDDGKWKAEASFSYDGDEVPCKVTRIEMDGARMLLAYQFDLGGYSLVSTLTGQAGGDTLSGKYETVTAEGAQPVDSGTFRTTRK